MTGSRFIPSSTITISIDWASGPIFATADSFGGFTKNFSVPAGAFVGPHTVLASDGINSANKIFTVTSPIYYMQDNAITDGYGTFSSRQINAEYANPTSSLVGKNIDTIILELKKVGSPTGTAIIGVFNTDLSVKVPFASVNVSTLGTSYSAHTFSLPSGQTYTIQSGDRIGIKYTGGDGSNFVAVTADRKNGFDGTNSYYAFYGTTWGSLTGYDLTMTLEKIH
jgi:hypothetical protein